MPKEASNEFDKFISKTLSWLLRHSALKEKIAIDSKGFADLSDVLNHRSLKDKCDVKDVERIVKYNDKQRFTLVVDPSTNKLKIKANQGHSLKVVTDSDLKPISDANEVPDVIHGTYLRHWKKISNEGLHRMNRLHVHFASGLPDDNKVKSGMRKNCEIYIYIDLKKALANGLKFYISSNDVILSPGNEKGFIEPCYFLRVIQASNGM